MAHEYRFNKTAVLTRTEYLSKSRIKKGVIEWSSHGSPYSRLGLSSCIDAFFVATDRLEGQELNQGQVVGRHPHLLRLRLRGGPIGP